MPVQVRLEAENSSSGKNQGLTQGLQYIVMSFRPKSTMEEQGNDQLLEDFQYLLIIEKELQKTDLALVQIRILDAYEHCPSI